jgi:hypothetical protein
MDAQFQVRRQGNVWSVVATKEDLKAWSRDGRLLPIDEIRKIGSVEWIPVSRIRGLFLPPNAPGQPPYRQPISAGRNDAVIPPDTWSERLIPSTATLAGQKSALRHGIAATVFTLIGGIIWHFVLTSDPGSTEGVELVVGFLVIMGILLVLQLVTRWAWPFLISAGLIILDRAGGFLLYLVEGAKALGLPAGVKIPATSWLIGLLIVLLAVNGARGALSRNLTARS